MDIIFIQQIVCKALGTGKLFPCPCSAHISRQNVEGEKKKKTKTLSIHIVSSSVSILKNKVEIKAEKLF